MILTDKAKEKFLEWRKQNGYELALSQSSGQGTAESFDKVYQIYEHALIIDWFSTLTHRGKNFWFNIFDYYYQMRIESQTISDVNKQTIEKCNEIFNNLTIISITK